MSRPLAWHVASFADGDTHLAHPAVDGEPVTTQCGKTIDRPLKVLSQEPGRLPPDPAQACQKCRRKPVPRVPAPVAERLPAGAVLLVRLKPNVVGETKRVVHAAPRPAGDTTLRAYCGAVIKPGTYEILHQLAGMPCNPCILRAPSQRGVDSATTGRDRRS